MVKPKEFDVQAVNDSKPEPVGLEDLHTEILLQGEGQLLLATSTRRKSEDDASFV